MKTNRMPFRVVLDEPVRTAEIARLIARQLREKHVGATVTVFDNEGRAIEIAGPRLKVVR